MADEIPEALRDKTDTEKPSSKSSLLVIGGVFGLGAIALIGSFFLFRATSESNVNPSPAEPNPVPSSTNTEPTPESTSTNTKVDDLLGHLPYQEAPISDLKAVTEDGRVKLRTAAAEKFRQMQAAANADGVILTPISGFRSVSEQQYLFFQIKEQRGQVTTKRAEVSAPPGYSEHHTGYAIDLGDGRTPASNLNTNFEKTSAFGWLQRNATRYSFELSFPPDNPQGISYEPWHWRFVGDRDSLETFYKVRR